MPYQAKFRFEHFKERSMEEYERILNPDPEHRKVSKIVKNGIFVELVLRNKEDGYMFARGGEEVRVLMEFYRRLQNLKCEDKYDSIQEFLHTGRLPRGYNTEGELMGGLTASELEKLTKWQRVNGRLMRKAEIKMTPVRRTGYGVTRAQSEEIASARKIRSDDPREQKYNQRLTNGIKAVRKKLFTP